MTRWTSNFIFVYFSSFFFVVINNLKFTRFYKGQTKLNVFSNKKKCCIYSDPAVHALQFLDVINMKDPTQKAHFYRNTLREVLPFIPRVI